MSLTETPANLNGPAEEDLTGRKSMPRNVLTSWGAQLVFIVAGFIMPRLIDERLGQTALGVWDFGWSTVAYFSLVTAGLVSSVNRYVARHRATGDMAALNESVSSVACVLLIMAAAVAALALTASWLVPKMLSGKLGGMAAEARGVVLLLGLGLAVQIALSAYGGVLTGCHRWGLHNGIHAASQVAAVAGMILVIVLGGGIIGLAWANILGETAGWVLRWGLAHRVCPHLSVRPRLARLATAGRMFGFGGKSFVPYVAELLTDQTVGMLIVGFLGAPALALYSRPRSLIRHVRTLITKFSNVLTPTASSLHATGDNRALQELVIKTTRTATYLGLPMVLVLIILGKPILEVWMRAEYASVAIVLTILAIGRLFFVLQLPLVSILTGMNAHGRPGVANLIASALSVALAFVALGPLKLGLSGAAWAVSVPMIAVNAIYMPILACRRLNLPLSRYIRACYLDPAVAGVAMAVVLVASRIAFSDTTSLALAVGAAAGAIAIAPFYWRAAIPAGLKGRIMRTLRPSPPAAQSETP